MLKVGITGGIGSGKSVVCKIFETLKIPVYNADSRAKWLMNYGAELKVAIIAQFGSEAYGDNGLNRNYLAKVVFKDENSRQKLNALVHPAVAHDYTEWCRQHENRSYTLKEAALLFETGSYQQLDHIILVTAPEELRIRRVHQRDPQRSVEQIRRIIKSQWPDAQKLGKSDFHLHNDEAKLLTPQVLEIHRQLLEA